jgi:hypothetical protein
LYGATVASDICATISKWTVPDKFYAAFPYGVYPAYLPAKFMKEISNLENFFFSYEGKTVKDGEYLGFTFNHKDIKTFSREIKRKGTGQWLPFSEQPSLRDGKYPTKKYPIEERWSARFFELEEVFEFEDIKPEQKIELEWYYNISSWDKLCVFLGSDQSEQIKRPSKHVLSYHELPPIGGKFEIE